MIHPNSSAAYAAITDEGITANRCRLILAFLRNHGASTERDVMLGLGFCDMNSVRPRLSELIDDGRVLEVGSRPDAMTGRKVRVVAAALV